VDWGLGFAYLTASSPSIPPSSLRTVFSVSLVSCIDSATSNHLQITPLHHNLPMVSLTSWLLLALPCLGIALPHPFDSTPFHSGLGAVLVDELPPVEKVRDLVTGEKATTGNRHRVTGPLHPVSYCLQDTSARLTADCPRLLRKRTAYLSAPRIKAWSWRNVLPAGVAHQYRFSTNELRDFIEEDRIPVGPTLFSNTPTKRDAKGVKIFDLSLLLLQQDKDGRLLFKESREAWGKRQDAGTKISAGSIKIGIKESPTSAVTVTITDYPTVTLPPDSIPVAYNQTPIWTPQVISTSLALIPVILSISIVCVLLLFMLLHCCSPKEVTHVTNNTYTTRIVGRRQNPEESRSIQPGATDGLNEVPMEMIRESTEPSQPSPSSDLYMPHYIRHDSPVSNEKQVVKKKWHRGLLSIGRGSKILHPYLNASRERGMTTDGTLDPGYVLTQAAKRLEKLPARPMSPTPTNESQAGLSSGLQETACGRETLRDRRKGMRDHWLSSLFTDRAPGTENLVVVEQQDGLQRGASTGGAREPGVFEIAESSLSSQGHRKKTSIVRGTSTLIPSASKAFQELNQDQLNSSHRLRSVKHYLWDTSKAEGSHPLGSSLSLHDVNSQTSEPGYQASQSDFKEDDSHGTFDRSIGKENTGLEMYESVNEETPRVATIRGSLRRHRRRSTTAIPIVGKDDARILRHGDEFERASRLHLATSVDGTMEEGTKSFSSSSSTELVPSEAGVSGEGKVSEDTGADASGSEKSECLDLPFVMETSVSSLERGP
jgi:hypothetical protein